MASLAEVYARESARAGGAWHAYVTAAGQELVARDADRVVRAGSVQKLAVAVALLDKVDRGELALEQRLELTAPIVAPGSGTYRLQAAYGDRLTLANLLVAMLQVSDNTAVRMLGRVLPGPEVNEILAAKGFAATRVRPLALDPHRFWLGTTTPRETHALLTGLAGQTLLSAGATAAMLRVLRWTAVGYTDGVRRLMSSAERDRVAAKHAADGDLRHEVGVVFDRTGAPALTFALFADGLGDRHNYGGTHPAVLAHAALGRAMLDLVDSVTA
ncbi:MAG TPA: serine hydrolase [Rugosimonospora sp.]|nr:serine hydrolase [Rugosimonospora sp.]